MCYKPKGRRRPGVLLRGILGWTETVLKNRPNWCDDDNDSDAYCNRFTLSAMHYLEILSDREIPTRIFISFY